MKKFDFFEKYYKLNDLYFAKPCIIIEKYYKSFSLGYKPINKVFIVRKYKSNDDYTEIFTNTKYKKLKFSNFPDIGDITIEKIEPITELCNDEELLSGKISRKRLIEIYKYVNNLLYGDKECEFSGTYLDEEVKKLMRKYEFL